jgi:hypothetical protein
MSERSGKWLNLKDEASDQFKILQVEIFRVVMSWSVVVGYQSFRGHAACHNTTWRHKPEDLDLNIKMNFVVM